MQIDGYEVPDNLVDFFYDGETGRRITDDEWDETKSRLRRFDDWPFDKVDSE